MNILQSIQLQDIEPNQRRIVGISRIFHVGKFVLGILQIPPSFYMKNFLKRLTFIKAHHTYIDSEFGLYKFHNTT